MLENKQTGLGDQPPGPIRGRTTDKDVLEITKYVFATLIVAAIVIVMIILLFGNPRIFSFVQIHIVGYLLAFLSMISGWIFAGGAIRVAFAGELGKFTSFSLKAVGSAAFFVLVLVWWSYAIEQLANYELIVYPEDAEGHPVKDTVVSIKGTQAFLQEGDNYWEFRIPPNTLPADGVVTVYAEKRSEFLSGKQDVRIVGDTRQSLTIRMERDRSATTKGAVVDEKGGKGIDGVHLYVHGSEQNVALSGPTGAFELAAFAGAGELIRIRAEKDGYEPEDTVAHAGEPVQIVLTRKK